MRQCGNPPVEFFREPNRPGGGKPGFLDPYSLNSRWQLLVATKKFLRSLAIRSELLRRRDDDITARCKEPCVVSINHRHSVWNYIYGGIRRLRTIHKRNHQWLGGRSLRKSAHR